MQQATIVIMLLTAINRLHPYAADFLLKALIVCEILIYCGNTANAAEMSTADRDMLKNEIKINCIKASEEDRKNYNQVYLWKVEDYCECCAAASSQTFTSEELSYFESNGTWPEGVMDRNRDIGFKCMGQATNKQ